MRSSTCKYVLDKVSKFEKKYSNAVQKSNEKDDDSISSKSFENEFKTIQAKYKFSRNSALSDMANRALDSSESKINLSVPTNSSQNSCREEENKIVTIRHSSIFKQSGVVNGSTLNDHGTDMKNNQDCSDVGSEYFVENEESSHVSEVNNELNSSNIFRQKKKYADNTLKFHFASSKNEESVINESGTSNRIDPFEGGIGKNRLQLNLNLKLEEDSDEVSEMSSNDIASLSQDNLDSSPNVPFRILMFEDLIRSEEVKPIDEKPKPVVEEKNKLDSQGVALLDNSISASLVDGSNHSEGGRRDEKSKIFSEVENHEVLTSSKESIDDSSVEEDIKILESFISEKSDYGQPHTSEKNVHNVKKIELNNEITELTDKESKLMLMSHQIQSGQSYDESVSNLQYAINDDTKEKKINKVRKAVRNNDRQHILFGQEMFCVEESNSDQELKLPQDKNKIRQKNMKHIKKTKEKHKDKEYSNHRIKQSCKSSRILQTNLCHVVTQTDNFHAETYEFEKRMGTIMNSSFDFMTHMNTFPIEDCNISAEQMIHSESGLVPLERGFRCSLKQQVELIKHFVHAEYKMYAVCMAAIKEMSATYKPSSLHHIRKVKKNEKISAQEA